MQIYLHNSKKCSNFVTVFAIIWTLFVFIYAPNSCSTSIPLCPERMLDKHYLKVSLPQNLYKKRICRITLDHN